MEFLYREPPKDAAVSLEQHLTECAECRKQVEGWSATSRELDSWTLRGDRPKQHFGSRILKWAIAAAVVLGIGFLFGRFSGPTIDQSALREEIVNSLRSTLTKDLEETIKSALSNDVEERLAVAERTFQDELDSAANGAVAASLEQTRLFLEAYERERGQEGQLAFAVMQRLESRLNRQAVEHTSLRREVETVALFTDAGFRRAQEELVRLVSYSEPISPIAVPPISQENR